MCNLYALTKRHPTIALERPSTRCPSMATACGMPDRSRISYRRSHSQIRIFMDFQRLVGLILIIILLR